MFSHRKISNPSVDEHWNKIKRTISREMCYSATEVIGEHAAEDMLEFADLNKHEIDRIYVKHRDGLPMAAGMRKIFPDVDIRYVVTRRYGKRNEKVHISFWDPWDGHSSEFAWFVDPMNARGTTDIETARYLHEHFPFDVVLFSHVVANVLGIQKVQTKITDFNMDGYMNYAFLSKRINIQTGFLEDALEYIPDFGDKVFGTLGSDYPIWQIQEDIKRLLGTGIGDAEILKGAVLHLIQLRSKYDEDRRASWPTREWITASILWYKKSRGVPFKIANKRQIELLLDDLVDKGFLSVNKVPWRKGLVKVYKLTDEGVEFASKVYLPILDEQGVIKSIKTDFGFLVHHRPHEIYDKINN